MADVAAERFRLGPFASMMAVVGLASGLAGAFCGAVSSGLLYGFGWDAGRILAGAGAGLMTGAVWCAIILCAARHELRQTGSSAAKLVVWGVVCGIPLGMLSVGLPVVATADAAEEWFAGTTAAGLGFGAVAGLATGLFGGLMAWYAVLDVKRERRRRAQRDRIP